jgi:hypothetical protein
VGDVSCQSVLKRFVDSRVNTTQDKNKTSRPPRRRRERFSVDSILKHNDGDRQYFTDRVRMVNQHDPPLDQFDLCTLQRHHMLISS